MAPTPAPATSPDRPNGPFDVSEVVDPQSGRFDMGALLMPHAPGVELRAEVNEGQVVAATLVLGDSAMQLQAFAAPRTTGIWDEVRKEIAAGITQQGGLSDEVEGTFGPELRAKVNVRTAEGGTGAQAARFIGIDGPRWFLRGVFTGQAATDPSAAEPLEGLLRQVVVVRGDAPMAPRDPLPLQVPPTGEPTPEGSDDDGSGRPQLDPFHRGPEITEIR